MKLYLDCDGVLADFDGFVIDKTGMTSSNFEKQYGARAFWKEMYDLKVFENLEPMGDAEHLVEETKHLNPTILTGIPMGDWAQPQKMRWRDKYFPGIPLICCLSKEKAGYCQPGDVLIDDTPKYRHLWIRAGGTFISHYDAKSSLDTLREYTEVQSL